MKKNSFFKKLQNFLVVVSVLLLTQHVHGQVNYVFWDFTSVLSTGNSYNTQANQDLARTTDLSNVTFTGTTLTGANYVTATTYLRTNGWATSLDTNKYVEFSVQLNSGQKFNDSSLSLDIAAAVNSTTTASRNYQVKYGWGSNPTFSNATNGLVTNLGTTVSSNTATIPAPGNSVTTLLTIRIHVYGASSGGNNRIYSIKLTGNSQPISLVLPPTLTSDTTLNTVDNNIDVTFTDDATWRAAITAVKIGTTALASTDYEITAGTIRLKPSNGNSLLTTSGSKSLVVEATGYSNSTVTQIINAGVPTIANSVVAINTPLFMNGSSTVTCTAKDQYNNLVSGYYFGYNTTVTNNNATTSETYTIDGTAVNTNSTDYLNNATNASGVATFNIVLPSAIDQNDGISIQVVMEDGVTNLGSPFTFVQTKLTQTISFGALSSVTYGDTPFTISATATSSLPVSFTSSNTAVATVSGTTVTIVGNGTTNITASQGGDSNYYAATNVVQQLIVNKKTLTVNNAVANNKVYDGTINATFSGSLVGIVGSDVVTLIGTGEFSDANVGDNKSINPTATLAGTNASKYILAQPTGLSANITKANQTITMQATLTKYLGSSDFSPATSPTSAINTITYTSSDTNVATIVSGQVHIIGLGSTTITASQAGSSNYNAASDVMMTLTVLENNDMYRSKTSGNWNALTSWQSSTDGSIWVDATVTPSENNVVYIQSGHTVTLTQNESCKDLHIANSTTSSLNTSRGIVALGNFNLSVFGKLRAYYAAVGQTPGTSSNAGFSAYPFTASTGKIVIKGNSRDLTVANEWGGNINTTSTGLFNIEIDLNTGETVTLNTALKVTTYNQVSGNVSIGNFSIGVDNGTSGQGNATVASGCILTSAITSGNLFQRTGSTLSGNFTLNGRLILTGQSPKISVSTINLNGTVEYNRSGNQNFIVAANSGATPNTYTNVVISNTGIKTFSSTITVNGILDIATESTLNAGSQQIIGTGSLLVNGIIQTSNPNGLTGSNATINGPSFTLNFGSTVEYTGVSQIISPISTYKNVLLSGVGPFIVQPTSVFNFEGTADFGGKPVTLQSDATGTATIAEITGTLNGATNVTVERYIPAKRAWRALTAPLKGSNGSLYATWQNNGSTVSGTGVSIWGPSGTNIETGPNYSVLNYTATGWVGVNNTSTSTLFDSTKNNAYLVFVTGPYGSNNIATNTGATATTLKATGQLITGTVNYSNIIDSKHTLIGNPYASALTPSTLLDGGTNLITNFWVWDPNVGTTGGYNMYDDVLNQYSSNTGSYPTNTTAIQSGQAFFVRATTGTTGSFSLLESKKSTAVSNVFGRTQNTSTPATVDASIFRVGMYKETTDGWKGADGAIVGIYATASNDVNDSDGKKMANGSENIAFVRNNTTLSSEHHAPIQAQDELYMRVWNTSVANYKLKINTENFADTTLEATLIDLFTGTQTPLMLDGSVVEYPFAVTSNTASTGDRFKVVFQNSALGVHTSTSASLKLYPNPATSGMVQVQLPEGDYSNCSYEVVNGLGQIVAQSKVPTDSSHLFSINTASLASSWYVVRIVENGKTIYQTKLIVKN